MKKSIARIHIAAQTDASEAFCLASAYEDGIYYGNRKLYFRKNKRLAFQWMQHSALLGSTSAMISLAGYFFKGYGCEKNVQKTIQWEKKAYCLGDCGTAAHNLGCTYRMMQKYRLAYQWFQKAYVHDKSTAFNLGKCCLFGQGVGKNTAKALQYFRETADIDTFPINKIHAMRLIADIQCGLPPTTKPLHSKRMAKYLVEKCAKCYEDELCRNPKNEAACWCLSQLYIHHKRYREALPNLLLCRQLSFCPEDIIPWLSGVYYELGMIKEEVELYQSCLKLNPRGQWAKRRLKVALKDLTISEDAPKTSSGGSPKKQGYDNE